MTTQTKGIRPPIPASLRTAEKAALELIETM